MPELGFELVDSSGIVIAQAEVAWPEERLALLASWDDDNDPLTRKHFESAGWTVWVLGQTEPTAVESHLTMVSS